MSPRYTHYRAVGKTWDGTPFDEVKPFTQIQAEAVSLAAVVHPDGLSERYARELVARWNRETARYGGTVYTLHAPSLPSP